MTFIGKTVLFVTYFAMCATSPSPTPSPTPSPKTPSPTPSPTPTPTSTTTTIETHIGGKCIGNDSRCAGSSQAECNQFRNQGASCRWDRTSTPNPPKGPTGPTQGECIGNDSRCTGSSKSRCTLLGNQGSDCRWENSSPIITTGTRGECLGNDSRCAKSRHAKCIRLSRQGSSCRWESSALSLASSGACAGHDTRCDGESEQSCGFLSQEGADCKWRKHFEVSGSLTMTVTNVSSFIQNPNATVAITEGIANLTGVPSQYIDVDLYVSPSRRLRGRDLSQTGTLVVTYVIVVGSDAPATVAVTGSEIGQILTASNSNQISAAITSKVTETFGNEDFNIVLADMTSVELVFSSDNTNTTSTNATNITTTTMTTTTGNSVIGNENGALSIGLARSLVLAIGIATFFL